MTADGRTRLEAAPAPRRDRAARVAGAPPSAPAEPDELAAEVAGPAGDEQRQASSACSTSASRSAVSSEPAESRMKPSGTASPPQRARRSAHVWTLPKLVASVTRRAAARKRSARSRAPEVERDDDAVAAHLAPRHLVARVGRQAGIADALHVVARGEQSRDRQGVVAAALDARTRASEASGARARSRTGPGCAPAARRQSRSACARSGSRVGHVAEQQVGVAAHAAWWRS